eukprot:gene8169-12255_t
MTYTATCAKARERLRWAPVWDMDAAMRVAAAEVLKEEEEKAGG